MSCMKQQRIIDVLESKLDQMSKELTAMRKQLVEMDNKTLAARN